MGPLLLNVLDKPVKEAGDKLRQVPLGLMGEVRWGGRCLCAQPGTAKHHERAVLGHLGTREAEERL